jgi:hypothetical protein
MSDTSSAPNEIPAKESRAAMAARYAAVVLGAVVGSAVLKLLLPRILAMPRIQQFWGPVILAFILGLLWFGFAYLALWRARSGNDASRQRQDLSSNSRRAVGRTITRAIAIAGVLAITGSSALDLNDEILESRDLPWIAPLITVQKYGFVTVNRMFPCQREGSDLGCEAYKWIPTFIAANTLAYFPFVLITLFSFQRWKAVRKTMQVAAHLFAHWCPLAAGAGLVALQVMAGLNLATQDSLFPNPGIGHWHFGAWEQINDITGTVITIAGLSLPFYLYRVIRRGQGLDEVRLALADATSLSATMLAALMLGDVY